MIRALLALALVATSAPALAGGQAQRQALPRLGLASSRAMLVTPPSGGADARRETLRVPGDRGVGGPRQAPACPAEVCLVRSAAMPEATGHLRVSRTDLVLGLLSRSRIPALANVATYIASANVRVDFRPGEPSGAPPGSSGWGKVMVTFRWKLDAENRPYE